MKYAILVLLLLMFGCLQPAEPGKVTEIDLPESNETSSAPSTDSSAADTTSDEPPETEDTNDPPEAPDETNTSDVPAPTISNSEWGTECEDSYDCGSFGDLKDCLMGHCVDIECIFTSDCKDEDHCFNGKCYLESELYAEFPSCGVNIGCNMTCSGCKSGKRRCMVTGWSDGNESMDYYICAECNSDYDCSEGYRCENKYCVKGPN
jgi:hypothetical protein